LSRPLDRLQRALGYRFRDETWLQRALTHRSLGQLNYERLEFLGDALLNFAVAEAVYQAWPRAPEGDLSRMRASLVREASLAEVARRLELGEAVRLGPGELKSGGFRRDSILADVLEAVLGAIYLDGGFVAAREACLRWLEAELAGLQPADLKDAKTRLQEWLQARPRPLPEYGLLGEEGPAHRRRFRVYCRLPDDDSQTQGEGASRKLAEQQAAECMLKRLIQDPGESADA
jgi:ribonuclease-3